MTPTGFFFKSKLNGLRGRVYTCLGKSGKFIVYKHKKNFFLLPLSKQKIFYKTPSLYYFDVKIYHDTYIRFLSLKTHCPGSEKIARNYSASPQAKIALLLPWKCPNTIICPYLAAI